MKLAIAGIVVMSVLSGCESDMGSSSGGVLPGDIMGVVALYDTLGKISPSSAGVTVSIEGSSTLAVSDSSGVFKLPSVFPGTYILNFTKNGYTSNKIFNIQHAGNGTLYLPGYNSYFLSPDALLRQIPTISLGIINRPFERQLGYRDSTWIDSAGIVRHENILDSILVAKFTTHFSSGIYQYSSILFLFSKSPQINPQDQNSYEFMTYRWYSDSSGAHTNIYRDSLINHGFKPNDQVFLTSAIYIDGYFDVSQRKYVQFFSKNQAPIMSFILP